MVDGLPSAGPSGFDIVQAVIKIKNLAPFAPRHLLDHLIEPGMRFHDVVLEGKDVAIKVGEKGELFSDVRHRQVICVGEDIGGNAVCPQVRVKLDHVVDRREDVAEGAAKFIKVAAIAGACADLMVELFLGDKPCFIAGKER